MTIGLKYRFSISVLQVKKQNEKIYGKDYQWSPTGKLVVFPA